MRLKSLLAAALVLLPGALHAFETAEDALRLALPEALIEFATLEVAGRENVLPGPQGGLTLRITEDQPKVNGGARAELSVDYPFKPGDTLSYSWRFRIPEDFASDAPENRFVIAGQWHDQPDTELGESWEDFPRRSPPIAIYLGELNGEVGFVLSHGSTDGKSPRSQSDPIFFERGEWQKIEAEITWSRTQSGAMTLRLNGDTVACMTGPNMNNNAPHYLKLGLYRHPDIQGPASISIKDVNITK